MAKATFLSLFDCFFKYLPLRNCPKMKFLIFKTKCNYVNKHSKFKDKYISTKI